MRISKHFALEEFLRSQTAARLGIDMTPDAAIVAELTRLATTLLDPIREVAGPLYVDSGYRPSVVNSAVGGAINSDHLYGRAADIVPLNGGSVDDLMAIISDLRRSLPLHKAISEFGWVHVSIAAEGVKPLGEFLVAVRGDGGTIYSHWSA